MFTNSSHAMSILLHVWDVDVLDGHHWTVWCVHGSAVYSDGKGCNGMLHSIYDNCQENKTVFQILKIYNPVTRYNFLLSFWTWTIFLFSLKQGLLKPNLSKIRRDWKILIDISLEGNVSQIFSVSTNLAKIDWHPLDYPAFIGYCTWNFFFLVLLLRNKKLFL